MFSFFKSKPPAAEPAAPGQPAATAAPQPAEARPGWAQRLKQGLAKTRDEAGGQAVGGLASAKCTNEENYLFQKLLRAGIGTNNIDHCARL